jgi:hypothetical protein
LFYENGGTKRVDFSEKPSREIRISQIANFGLSALCCNRIGSFCNPYAKGSLDLVKLSKFGLGEGSNAVLRNPGARARHLNGNAFAKAFTREGDEETYRFAAVRKQTFLHEPD